MDAGPGGDHPAEPGPGQHDDGRARELGRGGVHGRPVAPNNVIDNAADLSEIGVIRLAKLKTLDAYNYTLTIRVLRPASDPRWFRDASATDRVRLFLPGKAEDA